MRHFSVKLAVIPALILSSITTFAARPIDLASQPMSRAAALTAGIHLQEIKRHTDFNQTTHVRVQQTYQGYMVWGADAVIHNSHSKTAKLATKMNGIVYQGLEKDLAATASHYLTAEQGQKALEQAIKEYQQTKEANTLISQQQVELIIFIDKKDNKAHWAYKVGFDAKSTQAGKLPSKPVRILDAVTLNTYLAWDNIKTQTAELGGGFGGNPKLGKLIYDGLSHHLSALQIKKQNTTCYLENDEVVVRDAGSRKVMNYPCGELNTEHNYVYWNGSHDAVNGGYSPANDALYAGNIIKQMYQDWYHVPVLTDIDGKAKILTMVVHEIGLDNAYWDGSVMTFGDGASTFYPLTSLGVAAHEISHGFTEQHSNLIYSGQSGGINEAFSDMAAQAAEFYAYGKNTWQIGGDIIKQKGDALRYMDQPSKDCQGWPVGWNCSIDSADQYGWGFIDVHHSSGVYNRLFYLLANSKGWDVKKAFDVMVKANTDYWTSGVSFSSAACGIISATHDYGYDDKAVKTVLDQVKIKVNEYC